MKKIFLLATAALMITGVSMADNGKKQKCSKGKKCCAKTTKECCKGKDKTAKL
ncbi:MAG: hypothetical protein ABJB11_09085 [Ferruginibacter sp.]